jgi:hypothetical protein
MNINFNYLYRDAGNYKQHNQVVFANPNELPIQKIKNAIAENLIDGCWFVAKNWNVPDLHFKEYDWDAQIDHDWHEFECVEETSNIPTEEQSIEDFIERIKVRKSQTI